MSEHTCGLNGFDPMKGDTCPSCKQERDDPKHYTSRCAGDYGCYCEDSFHDLKPEALAAHEAVKEGQE